MAKLRGKDRLRHRVLREVLAAEERHVLLGLADYRKFVASTISEGIGVYAQGARRVRAGEELPSLVSQDAKKAIADRAAKTLAGAANRLAGDGSEPSSGVQERPHGALLDVYAAGKAVATLPRREQKSIGVVGALRRAKKRMRKALGLSRAEELALASVQGLAWERIRKIAQKVVRDTEGVLAGLEDDLVAKIDKMLQQGIEVAVSEQLTVRELESRLRRETRDWARDWRRVAMTEMQSAMQAGVATGIEEEYGEDAVVVKIPRPDACQQCRDLYLGADGKPRKMPVSELVENGHDNTGRKRANWRATVGAVHPHCSCEVVHLLPGMEFEGELADLSGDSTEDRGLRVKMQKSEIQSHAVPGEDVHGRRTLATVGGEWSLWGAVPWRRAPPKPVVPDVLDVVDDVSSWLDAWRRRMEEKAAVVQSLKEGSAGPWAVKSPPGDIQDIVGTIPMRDIPRKKRGNWSGA